MRPTERIAAEAIVATCGNIDQRTLNYAIDIGRTEALSEMFLRRMADRENVYIITRTSWNDLVQYIRAVEFTGEYYCTNTGFNAWQYELSKAGTVVLLHGWNNTEFGRRIYSEAKAAQKKVIHWQNSKFKNYIYETRNT